MVEVGDYVVYYRILIIQLVANIFDISWFFQGIEEFDKTVIRNLIVKLLSLVLIFTIVKTPNDLWLYFLIFVGAELIGNITLWFYIPKYIEKVKLKELTFKKHIKPTILLFLPQIAIQIYTVLDKTMIGKITGNMLEVGYYEQAQKIVKAALTITGALQTVMSSRIANAYAVGDKDEIKRCLGRSINFVWFLTVPMMFGLISISSNFVPWYYGDSFDRVIPILMATSPILIFIGLSGVTGIQYLVQIGKQKEFTISVTIGALVNIIFNFILIKQLESIGAVISSVIAEATILIIQLIYIKNQITILEVLKLSIKCIISGIVMFIVVRLLVINMSISILNTLIQIIVGAIVYFVMLKITKYKFLEEIQNQVSNGLKNKILDLKNKKSC